MSMRRRLTRCALALMVPLALAAPALGQSENDLRQELEALKQGQKQIQQELAELKKLLEQREAPAAPSGPNVAGKVFDLAANPTKGDPSARLTLIEWMDYQ